MMKKSIRTTVNLDYTVYAKLLSVVESNNLCANELVKTLIALLRTQQPMVIYAFKQVRYQERIPGRIWKRFHVGLAHTTYETCLDLRKLHKFSVSGLLSMGIEMYLEKAVEVLKVGGMDNYPENYILLASNTASYPCYMIFYSLPPEKILDFIFFPGKNTA